MAVTLNASTTTGLVQSADTSGIIELQSNGTTALTVNTNEGIQILNCLGVGNATPSTSGAGITFPASQSASTDANTLDDYEEGTWTPVDGSGAGLTLTVNGAARYVKIGRFVFFAVNEIVYPSTANSSVARINGLPFTSDSINSGTLSLVSNTANASKGLVLASATGIFIYANGTISSSTNANLSTFSIYGISGCYQV